MSRYGTGLAIAICLLATSVVAAEPHRLAFSKKLGVDVFALPDDQGTWCRPELSLSIALGQDSPLMKDGIEGFVPKLAPVLAQECPDADKALVQAYKAENHEPIGSLYAANKSANWALKAVSKENSGAADQTSSDQSNMQKTEAKPDVPRATQAYDASSWNLLLAYSRTDEDILNDDATVETYLAEHDCRAFRDIRRNEFKVQDYLQKTRAHLTAQAAALGPYAKISFRSVLGKYDSGEGAFAFDPLSQPLSLEGPSDYCSGMYRAPVRSFVFSWENGNGIYGLPLDEKTAGAYVQKIIDDYRTRREVYLEVIAKPTFQPMDVNGQIVVDLELLEARAFESNRERKHLHTFTQDQLIEGGKAWARAKQQAEEAQLRAEAEREKALEIAEQKRNARLDYQRLQYAPLSTKIAYLVGSKQLDTLSAAIGKSLAAGTGYPATFLVQAGESGKKSVEASWPGRLTLNLATDAPEFKQDEWYVVVGIMEAQPGDGDTPPTGNMGVLLAKQCAKAMCAEADDAEAMIRHRYPEIDWSSVR